jgi:hypothetical protein
LQARRLFFRRRNFTHHDQPHTSTLCAVAIRVRLVVPRRRPDEQVVRTAASRKPVQIVLAKLEAPGATCWSPVG